MWDEFFFGKSRFFIFVFHHIRAYIKRGGDLPKLGLKNHVEIQPFNLLYFQCERVGSVEGHSRGTMDIVACDVIHSKDCFEYL